MPSRGGPGTTGAEGLRTGPASRRRGRDAPPGQAPGKGTGKDKGRPPEATGTGRTRRTAGKRPPPPVVDEIARVAASRAPKVERALVEAASAYNRGRAQDAWRILRPLARDIPDASAIRELAGLALYRLGRWKAAAKELEEFRRLTGSVDQNPVLADCYRATGRYKPVGILWDELKAASPGPELMNEGRIVAAGARADQGDLRGAIELLEMGPVRAKRAPKMHDLRLWYALADLYERAGDAPRARELLGRVVKADATMADAAERLQGLQ